MINNYTCKLPLLGSESMCILNTQWADQEVKLLLIHGNKAWSGNMKNNTDAEELMGLLSLTEDRYFEETKKALTMQGGLENFTYSLDKEQFTWKKQVGKKMAIKFGVAQICEITPCKIFENIIDKTIQSTEQLSEKLQHYENQNTNLISENRLLKEKLDELIDKKTEMESTLYSQFLSLLNEKKRKISSLEATIRQSKTNHNDTTGVAQSPDPFDTDTEIDSEEDEKNQSPSKILICKNEESSESEEGFCSLPKRSRRNKVSDTVQPSTSGVKKQQNKTKNMPKPTKTDSKATTALPKRSERKGKKESCVLGKIEVVVEKKDSNEDAFNFPTKSKPSKFAKNEGQPSPTEVDCDIKEESAKETDSDRTPSGIAELPLTMIPQERKKRDGTDQKENLSCKDGNQAVSRKEIPDQSFNTFSSSTLDLLNKLI